MSSKFNNYFHKLKNYVYNNKGKCIMFGVIFILVCLNIYQANNISSLEYRLDNAWYENNIQNEKISELQQNIDTLKSEIKDLSNTQSSLYVINRDQRTTEYNIDKLKNAHNELVKFIECLGRSYCISRGSLITLY